MEFAILTGVQVHEQFFLKWDDVDFENRQLQIWQVKTSTFRTLSVGDDVIKILKSLPVFGEWVFAKPDGNHYQPAHLLDTDLLPGP